MTTLLTTDDLSYVRTTQADAWPDTATHLTATSTVNAIGEATLAWGTAGTAIPCRLAAAGLTDNVQLVAGENVVVPNWIVTMEYDKTVISGDRVVISGKTLEVITSKNTFGWRTALRLDCLSVEA
jgi:hypothetical protein